jgi:hypothetical protein
MSTDAEVPRNLEAKVAVGLLVVLALVTYVLYRVVQGQFPGVIAGGLVGFLSGVLTLFIVFFAQLPRFEVKVKEDELKPGFTDFYKHLLVKNTSWGFLGGGAAIGCTGVIEMAGKSYVMKWETRPEPLMETGRFVKKGDVAFAAGVPQSWLMEQATHQDLWPGETGSLDVALKSAGDVNCYIHTAENVRHPDRKLNPVEPGSYPFTLSVKPAGRKSSAYKFILHNDRDLKADSVRVEADPGGKVASELGLPPEGKRLPAVESENPK